MSSKAGSRREFLKVGAALGAAAWIGVKPSGAGTREPAGSGPAGFGKAVASGNGYRSVNKAMEIMKAGGDPLTGVIDGVAIVEDDPEDMSVGYGGLPNEDGVVELDASVMYGPTHSSGAVASIRNIRNPSKVARLVMERTRHCLLAGEGARRFALAHGFQKEDLLTEKAREAWLRWKETLSDRDNWLPRAARDLPAGMRAYVSTHGTINCLALDSEGRLAGVTTTSGLSWKIAGRVGDSPIIGAGLYVDNSVGAAGSTGLGEANIMTLASFQVVQGMERGLSPEEACLETLKKVADLTRRTGRHSRPDGRPNFDIQYYALSVRGEAGAASMYAGAGYAVHDGIKGEILPTAYLFKD